MDKVEYSYDVSNGVEIIIRKFYGEIIANDIIESFSYLVDNNLFKDNCIGVISDFCNATIDMKTKDLKEVVNYIKQNRKLNNLKFATVVDTPDKSIFPFLAQSELDVQVRPFSTLEAAKKWILSGSI